MKSILLADDDDAVRTSLAAMLRRGAWNVTEASDGAEACRLFREHRTDIVLTDLMMPRLDGLGVLAEIRALDPAVPIVMLTGFATIDRCREALKSGATDFVTKPCQSAELERVLNRLLDEAIEGEIIQAIQSRCSARMAFSFPADPAWRSAAASVVLDYADTSGFASRHASLRVAIEEALDNAIVHGAGGDGTKDILVSLEATAESITIRVEDPGLGFDPGLYTDQTLEAGSGKGLFLMRSLADEARWDSGGRAANLRFSRGTR